MTNAPAITNFGCTYFVIRPDTGIKTAMASPPGNNNHSPQGRRVAEAGLHQSGQ